MPLPFPTSVLTTLQELAALPYENLSKILAFAEGGNTNVTGSKTLPGQRESVLVLSSEWLEQSRASGVGGTCFSLTWWLRDKLKQLGFTTELIMGDKGQLKNIHCALKWDYEGQSYLLDPGFMIFDPLLLPAANLSTVAWLSPNEVRLDNYSTHARGNVEVTSDFWRMHSGPKGDLKYRFDFRKTPVSETEFLSHWEASFDLPMMQYPVLNRIQNGVQYYLQKRNLLIRTADSSSLQKLSQSEFFQVTSETFHLPEALVKESLTLVLKRNPDFFKR